MSAHIARAVPLGVVLAIMVPAYAAIPPVTYLMPDTFHAPAGQQVKLHVEAGTPLSVETQPWPHEKLQWFFVRAAGTQQNRDTISPAAGVRDEVAVTASQPGVTVIGLDTKPAVATMPAAELNAFVTRNVALPAEKAEPQRATGNQPVRVRRVESATTMVRVPTPDGPELSSATAMSKTGQAVEIRPLFDPTMLRVGSDFPVRVYIGGTKRPHAKVQATSVTTGRTASATTDPTGATHFRIDSPGVWRVEFHHAERLENDADADWVIYSATLTFEVGTEGDK